MFVAFGLGGNPQQMTRRKAGKQRCFFEKKAANFFSSFGSLRTSLSETIRQRPGRDDVLFVHKKNSFLIL